MRPGIALRDSAEQRLAMAHNAAVDAMFTPREARIENLPDVQHLPWGPTSRGFRGLGASQPGSTLGTIIAGVLIAGYGSLMLVGIGGLGWLLLVEALDSRRRRR